MSDRQQRQARAAEEAATWLVRLEAGDLSSETRGEFVDWLRDSPVHMAEMLRIARLRSSLTRFDKWEQLPHPPELSGDVEITDEAHVDSSISPPHSAGVASRLHEQIAPRKLQWGLAAAAAILVLATSIGLYWFTSTPSVIRTQLGERREMSLADGSVVAVSPDSEIRVLFDAKRRLVILDRGQAYFHVGKDPNRPFLVDAAGARARALGTAFSVEQLPDSIVVTVVEGRVAVSPTGGGQPNQNSNHADEIALNSNQQLAISRRGAAAHVRQIDGRVEQAWSQGQIIFENDTVAAIVQRFNTYNRTKIRVTDPVLAARSVSGVLQATDPQSFVAFLESTAGATAREGGPDEIIIERSDVSQPELAPR